MSLKLLRLPTGPTNQSQPIANLFNFCFSIIRIKFGIWTSPALKLPLLRCSAPTQVLPSSSFCPAPSKLLTCTFSAPAQLLPSFCHALLYSAQLYSCPAPGPAHPRSAAFIIISTLQLFSAWREPPFKVIEFRGRK